MPIEPLPGSRRPQPLAASLRVLARNLDAPAPGWVERLPEAWAELVGRRLAQVSTPQPGRAGRLLVEVHEPVVAEQFRFLASDLVGAVNRWAEEEVVTEVVVRVIRPGDGGPQW